MIEVFKIVHNFYDSRAVVKLDFIILTPLVQLEAINLNYKNIIVTTILENIHLFPELLISGIIYQIMLWRLTLLMHLRIVLINIGLIKMLFMTTNQI